MDNPDEWGLPDSTTCAAALQLSSEVSPAFLHNHCVRSYLFARELASARSLRAGVDYDDELLFLTCVLHDLGVTTYGAGDQRFEVEGADAAARFLRAQGIAGDRVSTVWQAITLHTSIGIAHRFGPVPAVSQAGIALDIDGAEKGLLPVGFADRVHAEWPRHNLGYAIAHAIALDIKNTPTKAPPFSFPAHLHALINDGPPIRFTDVVANSGWGDRPLATSGA